MPSLRRALLILFVLSSVGCTSNLALYRESPGVPAWPASGSPRYEVDIQGSLGHGDVLLRDHQEGKSVNLELFAIPKPFFSRFTFRGVSDKRSLFPIPEMVRFTQDGRTVLVLGLHGHTTCDGAPYIWRFESDDWSRGSVEQVPEEELRSILRDYPGLDWTIWDLNEEYRPKKGP